jgi:hypothetical protein
MPRPEQAEQEYAPEINKRHRADLLRSGSHGN